MSNGGLISGAFSSTSGLTSGIEQYNIGTALSTGSAAPCNFVYDYTCGADQNTIGSGADREQYSIKNLTGTDTTIANCTWFFRRHTSGTAPTGTAQSHIYNADGGTILASSDTQSVTGIAALADNCTTTGTAIVFTFDPAALWADDYYLAVKYDDGADRLGVLSNVCTVGTCTSPSGFSFHYKLDNTGWVGQFLNCVTACS